MNRTVKTLPVVIIAALTLAGCSTSGAPNTTETAAEEVTTGVADTNAILESIDADEALTALLPEAIASKGAIDVGSYLASPPMNFYEADGTTPVGVDVDVIDAIAARLGLNVNHQDMSFDSIITAVKSGRVDATISEMNDTKERQETIDFVDYFSSGISIVIQKENPAEINGTDDLCGKKVAVVTGTTQEAFATSRSETCEADGEAALELTATDSLPQNQTQLRTGRIDALLVDLPAASYMASTVGKGDLFAVVDEAPIEGAPYGIGIAKENTDLRDAIQQSLQSLIEDGTYNEILEAWGVDVGALKEATVNAG